MPVLKLTQEFMSSGMRCPENKTHIEFCDLEVPGLYVEVRSSSPGQGVFRYRFKDKNGKTCHERIGKTSTTTLQEARKKAKQFRAELDLGREFAVKPQEPRASITFSELFAQYLEFARMRKRSWRSDLSLYKTRLKDRFGDVPINSIRRADVLAFHSQLGQELMPATADHYIKCLRRTLNWGIDLELISRNVCANFPLFNPDNKIFKRLSDDELSRLLCVLKGMKNSAVPHMAFWLLATSCRLSECLNARWSDVDRANRRWYVSPAISKNKRGRWVPLSDTALDVLTQLTTEGRYEYLFVNEKTQKPFTSFMPVWRRVRVKAGLPKLRIHDLRGMGLSLMAEQGVPLLALKEVAGHSDIRITASTYARMSDASLLAAVQTSSRAIQEAVNRPSQQAGDLSLQPDETGGPVMATPRKSEQEPVDVAGAEGDPVAQPAAA